MRYCGAVGIACVPIGPIVFYAGFTRAFLRGETPSSSEMLAQVQVEVQRLASGRRLVICDGVGYPAVGSICGVSNAAVARSVGAPVIMVSVGAEHVSCCFAALSPSPSPCLHLSRADRPEGRRGCR
jgi:hypothetical protein